MEERLSSQIAAETEVLRVHLDTLVCLANEGRDLGDKKLVLNKDSGCLHLVLRHAPGMQRDRWLTFCKWPFGLGNTEFVSRDQAQNMSREPCVKCARRLEKARHGLSSDSDSSSGSDSDSD